MGADGKGNENKGQKEVKKGTGKGRTRIIQIEVEDDTPEIVAGGLPIKKNQEIERVSLYATGNV